MKNRVNPELLPGLESFPDFDLRPKTFEGSSRRYNPNELSYS